MIREWRLRRRVSQLRLALEAEVSARLISFLETGRSRPSPEMVIHLAEQLDVPLRERNRLLLAAGFAPRYGQCELGEPAMEPVREAIEQVLSGHEPYPALVVDGEWELLAANDAVTVLTELAAPALLDPPLNVLRVSLHPDGLAPWIINLVQWRAHLLDRVRRQIALTDSAGLRTLLAELEGYPAPGSGPGNGAGDPVGSEIAVPLRLRTDDGVLSFISTISTFGAAAEVSTSELSIESFFPLDEATALALRRRVRRTPGPGSFRIHYSRCDPASPIRSRRMAGRTWLARPHGTTSATCS